MKTTIAIFHRTIDTHYEFTKDDAVVEQFSFYSASAYNNYMAVYNHTGFIRAYVCNVDPEINYGMSSKVFIEYRNALGMRILHQVKPNACLSNAPMSLMMIEGNEIIRTDIRIAKTDANRKLIADADILVD